MSTKLWTGAVFVVVECTHELFRKAGRVGNYTSFFFCFFFLGLHQESHFWLFKVLVRFTSLKNTAFFV